MTYSFRTDVNLQKNVNISSPWEDITYMEASWKISKQVTLTRAELKILQQQIQTLPDPSLYTLTIQKLDFMAQPLYKHIRNNLEKDRGLTPSTILATLDTYLFYNNWIKMESKLESVDWKEETKENVDDLQSLKDTVVYVVHNGAGEVSISSPQEPPSQRMGVTFWIHAARTSGMIDNIVKNPNDMDARDLMAVP